MARFCSNITIGLPISIGLPILVRFFPVFGLNTEIRSIYPYSVQMLGNTDQNNSEYGHFLRSVLLHVIGYYLTMIL